MKRTGRIDHGKFDSRQEFAGIGRRLVLAIPADQMSRHDPSGSVRERDPRRPRRGDRRPPQWSPPTTRDQLSGCGFTPQC